MELTFRDTWTVVHGMGLGALFLIGFAGGLAGFFSLRPDLVTELGVRERVKRLLSGTVTMAVVSWLTVVSGTYGIYVWYRDPAKTSPRSTLLADPATVEWHKFGMEWKEHVAWISPILATVVAYVVWYYGRRLVSEEKARRLATTMFIISFVTAAVAGVFGAFINKVAPTR